MSSSEQNTMVKTKKIKNVELSFFATVKIKTFPDYLQNLWAKHCYLKTVDGNMSRMYYTKVNFLTLGVVHNLW